MYSTHLAAAPSLPRVEDKNPSSCSRHTGSVPYLYPYPHLLAHPVSCCKIPKHRSMNVPLLHYIPSCLPTCMSVCLECPSHLIDLTLPHLGSPLPWPRKFLFIFSNSLQYPVLGGLLWPFFTRG